MKPAIPIYLFTGFLGSGKTTLLKNALNFFSDCGKNPAVIMNEVGEINVDSHNLEKDVPVAEILGGCICCSVSDDLGTTIINLSRDFQPDIIIIESTGIAYPMEVISGITEASLHTEVELKLIVTVIDAPHLLEYRSKNQGKTFHLMKEQIRCGGLLILNKSDKVTTEDIQELKNNIRQYNPYAPIQTTVHCKVDFNFLDTRVAHHVNSKQKSKIEPGRYSVEGINERHAHDNNLHDHVMVYTHYFGQQIELEQFEFFISNLPREVYRAKGIMQFKNKSGPMLFQYAYKELEMVRFNPKINLTNVAVFIGEKFSKKEILNSIKKITVN